MKDTIFWHDYETFGIDPQLSNVAQFAGIRTDLDLNIIGEKVDIICRPTLDRLPSPEACMVTGISPLINKLTGMNEVSFFQKINKELGQPGTCGVGYNNIQFDDEVTRNGLYRNFIDPYTREWKDNCSRWDLLNVLRVVSAIKPDTFIVPIDPDTGKKVFKLDQLSLANGIEHENAHDALADVIATIEMAKIVKTKEPDLFNLLFSQRKKNDLLRTLSNIGSKPFIMADSFFGGDKKFIEILYPVYIDNVDVVCIKLTEDISRVLTMSGEELKELLYKKKVDMAEGEVRLPIHSFKANKCPIILPISYMTAEIAKSLELSGDLLRSNLKIIKENMQNIESKLRVVFKNNFIKDETLDVDLQIYGSFFSNESKATFNEIKSTASIYLLEYLEENKNKFDDPRIEEMLFRYTCRNFDDELDNVALKKWNDFCRKRITEGKYSLTFEQYYEKITEFEIEYKDDDKKLKLLKDLRLFGEKTHAKLFE